MMNLLKFSFSFVLIELLISCYASDVHTYYCKELDYTFKMIEKDTFDVLVLGEGDSVFYSHSDNGDYLWISFYLSPDSNLVYFDPSSTEICHRFVEHTLKFTFLKRNKDFTFDYSPYETNAYWRFYGGCDQGSYTFGVFHDSTYVGTLEPLEWK